MNTSPAPADAGVCTPQPQKCRRCKADLKEGAEFCPECECYQTVKKCCYRCKADLREDSRFCTECNSYQTNLRFVPTVPLVQSLVTLFSLIVNVVAVGALAWGAVATDQDKVVLQLISVDPRRGQVILLALNSGTRAAAIRSARMIAPPSVAAQTTAPAWQLGEPDDKVILPGSARQIALDANAVDLPQPVNGLDKPQEFRIVVDILRANGAVKSHDLRYQGITRK